MRALSDAPYAFMSSLEREAAHDPKFWDQWVHESDLGVRGAIFARDYRDLLLPGLGLIVLPTFAARRQLKPVDPKRLDTKRVPHKTYGSARPVGLDVLHVHNRIAHPSEP
jgi:hypothetical protein